MLRIFLTRDPTIYGNNNVGYFECPCFTKTLPTLNET
jgi:hypothetical protein